MWVETMKRWLLLASIVICSKAYCFDEMDLSNLLEDARRDMEMPGLRASVRLRSGRVISAAVGFADVETEIPLDNSVGMPGGSTGKSFVAALTMILVEEKILSLDDKASKWLDESDWYKNLPNSETIRVRHLLTHTSGISDYPASMRYQIQSVWRALRRGSIRFEPEELIGFVSKGQPLFKVGEGFAYSDAGYLVLGRLIEYATGRTYYELVKERILIPQQLNEVEPADRSVLRNITPGYTRGARNLKADGRMKFDPSSEWTGGGLITNPTMLVLFYAALAEGRIVRPVTLTKMLASGFRDPGKPDEHYGLGLFVYNDGESFGHGGMWPGYRTRAVHYIESGTTIAVQTNRDGPVDMKLLLNRIAELVSE